MRVTGSGIPRALGRALASLCVLAIATAGAGCGGSGGAADGPPDPHGSATWRSVLDENFGGTALDTTRWWPCYWWADDTCTNAANHELQVYTPANVAVADGRLAITAQRRNTVLDGANYDYASGLVSGSAPGGTRVAFRYGYVEARARIPRGSGLWSALWLLNADQTPLPEIDVFEVVGETPDLDYTAVHVAGADGNRRRLRHRAHTGDLSDGFHVFGLLWEPDQLRWFVDGREVWRVDDPAFIPQTDMYLITNLAVGGDFPTEVTPETPFPARYEVDYIRVWQHR